MLKLLSLFSGIGAFEKALENIDEPFELINYCEIDKYANKAYSLIHNVDENLNLGDITTIDTSKLSNVNMITYGFPCQDISNAGKQAGFHDNNGNRTRSGLFFEALRIIEDLQPKFAIAENVKALTTKKFKAEFEIVLKSIEKAGYTSYWALLNAKDYGVPQNRERVFIISIRNDIEHGFDFPKPYPLKRRLIDVLETNVDIKYYLSQTAMDGLLLHRNKESSKGNGFGFKGCRDPYGYSFAITTKEGQRECSNYIDTSDPKVIQIGNCKPTRTRENPNQGRIYDINGISPTLNCCSGGNRQPYIFNEKSSIRRLTPKECFRLMGFDDSDVDILSDNGISNTQLYKMAGNSIVVDVLEEIFVELLNQYSGVI